MEKKTKVICVLVGLVMLGVPAVMLSQETTQSFSDKDSPLYQTRNTLEGGGGGSQTYAVAYLGQNNSNLIIPRIVKILESKGIILPSQTCYMTNCWGCMSSIHDIYEILHD